LAGCHLSSVQSRDHDTHPNATPSSPQRRFSFTHSNNPSQRIRVKMELYTKTKKHQKKMMCRSSKKQPVQPPQKRQVSLAKFSTCCLLWESPNVASTSWTTRCSVRWLAEFSNHRLLWRVSKHCKYLLDNTLLRQMGAVLCHYRQLKVRKGVTKGVVWEILMQVILSFLWQR